MSQFSNRRPALPSRVAKSAVEALFTLRGWTIEGLPPAIPKFVITAAPHTTNWDFVTFAGAAEKAGIEPAFMGKHTLFQGFMGNFMRDMGGISIDRSRRANTTQQVAEQFARAERLALVIAVEGSRGSKGEWRSGFYHIAQAADVPIVPAFADAARKVVGFGPPLTPSGDYPADLAKLAHWMRARLPDLDRFKVLEAQAARLLAETERAPARSTTDHPTGEEHGS